MKLSKKQMNTMYVVLGVVAVVIVSQQMGLLKNFRGMVVKNDGTVDVEAAQNQTTVDVEQDSNLDVEPVVSGEVQANDLLPEDDNLGFALSNPKGQGKLEDKNFLKAGYHIGINSVGQSLKNANYQLRSDPSIPRVPVSIFLNSTISADTTRRPLEIGETE